MKRKLVPFLLDLHGDMRVLQDRLETFIQENHMALDPTTEEALQRVTDAITNEIEEIKTIVNDSHDPTEINQRLDALAQSVSGISDAVQAGG